MLEVASFYSMFNLAPVGKYLVQICRTTPCWLRGSDALTEVCKKKLGIELKETSGDEKFTIMEVECLGACANAPMVQINDDYFEDLTPAKMEVLLDHLSKGKPVQPGSQTGRQASAPQATVSPEDGHFERVDISETLNDLKETDMAVAKKTTAKKTVAKKPAVKKVAKKTVAKKPVAKAAVKKTASKTAVKKPAVKKVAAKKPAAKKTVAKKK
jgi:NADH-quinone oxidoreductase subunit E